MDAPKPNIFAVGLVGWLCGVWCLLSCCSDKCLKEREGKLALTALFVAATVGWIAVLQVLRLNAGYVSSQGHVAPCFHGGVTASKLLPPMDGRQPPSEGRHMLQKRLESSLSLYQSI